MNKQEATSVAQSDMQELQSLFAVVAKGKQLWEATFDAIVDPVLIVNRHYEIERANLAAADSVNLDVRKLVGKRCYEAFARRSEPCLGCPLGLSLAQQTPHRNALEAFADHREFVASAFPIQQDDGDDRFVLQYQDVSEIRKLREELVQNEKMAALGLFSSGIAHDINNPLAGILAFAQLALEKLGPQEVQKEALQVDLLEIRRAALRCKKIIEDMLALSKPIARSEKSWTDVGELLRSVLPNLQIQWKNLEHRLEISLPNLPSVFVDATKFEQVFVNLLSNAFQAIPAGGLISVRGEAQEGGLCLEVADDGEGIAPEHLKSIFDPYFTTKSKRGGTGLGLPICYNILREHGGHIEVESAPGRGATFRLFIPRSGV